MVFQSYAIFPHHTPFDIYSRPRNRFVADFIGRANFISVQVEAVGKTAGIILNGKAYEFPSFNSDVVAS